MRATGWALVFVPATALLLLLAIGALALAPVWLGVPIFLVSLVDIGLLFEVAKRVPGAPPSVQAAPQTAYEWRYGRPPWP